MNKEKQQYNLIQRATFILGVVVLVGFISMLSYEMSQQSKKPPVLEISISQQSAEPKTQYQIWVQNRGEETAEKVHILLKLYQEGTPVESGTISIDYVPPGSKTEAWIVFHAASKSEDSLVAASVTYVIP